MTIAGLARELSDEKRIGLTKELVASLELLDEDVMRARLHAETEDDAGHLSVRLIGAYVIDDGDFLGKGEIYWWSIPALGRQDGKVTWSPFVGLPNGAPPISCGDKKWMREPSPEKPGLLAVIPPNPEIVACFVQLAFFDDDGAKANVPASLGAALETLAALGTGPKAGFDEILKPLRESLTKALAAHQDDRLLEKEIRLLRGSGSVRFDAGMIGSVVTPLAHAFYFVRDEEKTEQLGPLSLVKGQSEVLKFKTPPTGGTRIAVFSRGAVETPVGATTTYLPFVNFIVDDRRAGGLAGGLKIDAHEAAEVVVYVTP